jgi:hypothetical protein
MASKPQKQETRKVVRDSETGKFVPPEKAKTNPKTTQTETIHISGRSKGRK